MFQLTYLLDINWNLDLGHILGDVALKRGDIYGLAYCASHVCDASMAMGSEGLMYILPATAWDYPADWFAE